MSVILSSSVIKANDFPDMRVKQNEAWGFCPDLISLPSVSRIPLENEKIADVPDLRVLRSMSRSGLILFRTAMNCIEAHSGALEMASVRTGLYCGVDQGPLDYGPVTEIAQSGQQEIGSILIRSTMPKQIFKMYPNYSTNQVGIMLGVQGPMQTFTNMNFASLQALEQAEFDLWHGVVDRALVCAANSLEDPLVSLRLFRQSPVGAVLSEGGGALILAKSSTRTNWSKKLEATDSSFYGIADPLIRIVCDQKKIKET